MSKKDDIISALKCRKPAGAVPIWELEFHIWDVFSGKHEKADRIEVSWIGGAMYLKIQQVTS